MIKCTFENGGKADLRHVVVDAMVVKDNKILLVKRAPNLLNGNKYGLIGGFMDRDETLKEAVIREALEETGYRVKVKKLLGIVDNPNRKGEDRQNVAFIFLAEAGEKVGSKDRESTQVTWFDLDTLPAEDEFAFDHYELIRRYLLDEKK